MAEPIGEIPIFITGDTTRLVLDLARAVDIARTGAAALSSAFSSASPALDSLGNQFLKTGGMMTAGLTVPIVGLAAAMASGIDEFRKFELGMRQVTSLLGSVTQQEFKALSDATLELSTRLGVDAVDAAKGLYEAISAGVPKENALTFLEIASKTAIAGVTSTKVAVDGLTTVLNAFHLEASQTTKVADAMFMAVNLGKFTFQQLAASMHIAIPLAAQVGVSFQEVLAAAASLTKQGVPVAGAMTQIQRAITSLVAPSKEMQVLFERMGVESGKALLQSRGLAGSLQAVRDAAGGVESEMFKALRRMEGFRALLGLTGENAAGAAADLEKVKNSTGAMGLAFAEIEKSGARGFESLKVAMNNLSIQAAEVLAPSIAQIVKNMRPLIEGLIDAVKWFAALDPAVQRAGVVMLGIAAASGPVLMLAGALLKVREAAIVAAAGMNVMGSAVNLLAKAPWVALAGSLIALANATYDWKNARDSMHQSEQQQTDSLAKLEISLRQAGVNIYELSNQYNHGLIGLTEYLRGLQKLSVEHGNALPKVAATAKGFNDLGDGAGEASGKVSGLTGPIKEVGTAAKEAKTSIDAFMDSWNKQFEEAIPTTEQLAQAVRDVARAAFEAQDAMSQLPPLLDTAAGATEALAASAEASRRAMEGIIPPTLPKDIADITDRTKEYGDVAVVAHTRAKETAREVRQAINTISSGIADAIIKWDGFANAGITTLEAIGKAILKNIIQQFLDASGLVDKLVAGIGKVMAKLGLDAATSAASGAASAGGGLAASAGLAKEGFTKGGGAASGLASVLGIAGLGVSIASGITEGIQNAHMEADIAKIEISTRQVKEQLVSGVQPALNEWLPKLSYLLDIWKELIHLSDKMIPAILQNTQALANLLEDGGRGLGGGYFGSQGSPGGGTWEEIMRYLKILTQPAEGATEPDPLGGATMQGDSRNLGGMSRGFRSIAEASADLKTGAAYILKAGEYFTTLPARARELTSQESIEGSARRLGMSPAQFKAEADAYFAGLNENSKRGLSNSDVYQTAFGNTSIFASDDTNPFKIKELASIRAALETYRAGLINATTYENLRTEAIREYQAAMLPASRAMEEQRRASDPLVQAMEASAAAQRELAERTYALIQQTGGHSAVDIGNQSFINVGGAATGGSTQAGMSAEQNAAAIQQYAAQLDARQAAAEADYQQKMAEYEQTRSRSVSAAQELLIQFAQSIGEGAYVQEILDSVGGNGNYVNWQTVSDRLYQSNPRRFADFLNESAQKGLGQVRGSPPAKPVNNNAALVAEYAATLNASYRTVTSYSEPFSVNTSSPVAPGFSSGITPMGANGVTVNIAVYTNDPQVVANAVTRSLWENGVKTR